MARRRKGARATEAGNTPREPELPSAGRPFADWSEARIVELERAAPKVALLNELLHDAARVDRIFAALIPPTPGQEREIACELVAKLDAAGNPDPELRARVIALFGAAPLVLPMPTPTTASRPVEPSIPESKRWTPAELTRLLATHERFERDGAGAPTKRTEEWAAARFEKEKFSDSYIRRLLRKAKKSAAPREAHSAWVTPRPKRVKS